MAPPPGLDDALLPQLSLCYGTKLLVWRQSWITFLFPLGNIFKHSEKMFSCKMIVAGNRRYVTED